MSGTPDLATGATANPIAFSDHQQLDSVKITLIKRSGHATMVVDITTEGNRGAGVRDAYLLLQPANSGFPLLEPFQAYWSIECRHKNTYTTTFDVSGINISDINMIEILPSKTADFAC